MSSEKACAEVDQHYAPSGEIQSKPDDHGNDSCQFSEPTVGGDVNAVPKKEKAETDKANSGKKGIIFEKWAAVIIAGIAAFATGVQAFYADKQVQISRDIGNRQLRAYAIVEPRGRPHILPGQQAIGHLSVSIFGQTPAYKIHHVAKFEINDFPLPEGKLLGAFPNKTPYYITLAPGKDVSFDAKSDQLLTNADVAMIKYGTNKGAYIYGSVWYNDIFGINRCEMFCFVYMAREDGSIGRHTYCNNKWEGQQEAEKGCSQ